MPITKVLSKTSTITLNGTLAQVFPLFGPVREQEWAEGWHPRMLHSHSKNVEEHMVFQTDSADENNPLPYTWIVSKYDLPNALIEYTVFTAVRLWWITINCRQHPSVAKTRATITYTYVGLTEQGDKLNERAFESMFRHDLKDWEEPLNHYLETGTRLSHTHHPPSRH